MFNQIRDSDITNSSWSEPFIFSGAKYSGRTMRGGMIAFLLEPSGINYWLNRRSVTCWAVVSGTYTYQNAEILETSFNMYGAMHLYKTITYNSELNCWDKVASLKGADIVINIKKSPTGTSTDQTVAPLANLFVLWFFTAWELRFFAAVDLNYSTSIKLTDCSSNVTNPPT